MEKQVFDKFYDWYLKRINGERDLKTDVEVKDALNFFSHIEKLFRFLLRYENKDFYKRDIQIKECFEKGLFLNEIYHIGTNEYNELLNKKPQLKKLTDNQTYEIVVENEPSMHFAMHEVYLKTKNSIIIYDKVVQKRFAEQYTLIGETSLSAYISLKKVVPSKQNTKEGIFIPKEHTAMIFRDMEPQDVLLQNWNNKCIIVLPKKKQVDNFFNNDFYKLYNSKGEIVDKSIIDYNTIIKKIRDSVAHRSISDYVLKSGQHVILFTINKDPRYNIGENYSIIMDYHWFFRFCNMETSQMADNFSCIYFPNTTNKIETKEEFDDLLKQAYLLKINFKENEETEKLAFQQIVNKLMAQFKNDTKIKLSIDEFLTKNLSKYYQDVEIKMQQLTDIPNLWMRFNNAFAREKANNLTNKDFIDFQNKFFNLHLNNYFIDSINNSEKDDFKKLSNENVVNILAQYFNDYFQKSKHKIDYRIGFEVEDLVALCQLLIFQKLINNTLYDDIKKVNKSNIVDLDYLNSEFGKLRSAINALDMSKFEIINKKDPPRKVETLKDKIFAIRLLRNSISHDGFAYQLSNTKEIFDTYLRLYSYENPHLSLRVRIKHLLELLNNNFFKYLEDKPVEKKELPTVEELENIAKLKCNTEEEDED